MAPNRPLDSSRNKALAVLYVTLLIATQTSMQSSLCHARCSTREATYLLIEGTQLQSLGVAVSAPQWGGSEARPMKLRP